MKGPKRNRLEQVRMMKQRSDLASRRFRSFAPASSANPDLKRFFRDLATLCVIGIFPIVFIAAIHEASLIVVPVTAAILLGLMLGPGMQRLERWGVPSYLASGMFLILLCSSVYGLFFAFAVPADEWIRKVPEMSSRLVDEIRVFQGPFEQLTAVSETVERATGSAESGKTMKVEVAGPSLVTTLYTVAPVVVGQVMMFLGTLFFFMANRTRLRTGLMSFCISRKIRLRTGRIFRDVEFFLFRYVATITTVNIGLGVATWAAMSVLGMPTPALWGVLAGLLNYVPYLGPACVLVTLAGVGLVTFDTTAAALTPALVVLGLNVLESQFVTPAFIGRNLTLNPLLVFLSLAFWMWLWGAVGALLAVPILIVQVVVTFHLLPRRMNVRTVPFGKPSVAARANARGDETDRAFVEKEVEPA